MSLFICAKCGCVENTATSSYWALIGGDDDWMYDLTLLPYKGMPLCSECATLKFADGKTYVVPGKWHGKFPKRQASEEEKRDVSKDRLIH